eukprot:g4958.t1
MMRAAMHSWQTLMAFTLFYVEWPESIGPILDVVNGMSLDFLSVISPTCVGIRLGMYGEIYATIVVTIVVIALPWIRIFRCCCGGLFQPFRSNRNVRDGGQGGRNGAGAGGARKVSFSSKYGGEYRKLMRSDLAYRDMFLLIMLIHPMVSANMLTVFFPCQLINGTEYEWSELETECDANAYRVVTMVVAGLFLALFSAGTPLFFFWKLYSLKKKVTDIYADPQTRNIYGVLYLTYRPECYYFESVSIIFKLLLWMMVVFFGYAYSLIKFCRKNRKGIQKATEKTKTFSRKLQSRLTNVHKASTSR